jgi:vanillate O-demethylase monooxygenase subunit
MKFKCFIQLLTASVQGAGRSRLHQCPHRFAPLHLRRIRGDFVECGCHGLQFDGHGNCVHKERKTIYGGKKVMANFELIADNLMDASHTQYVHLDLLGTDAFSRSKHEVIQDGTTVHSNYVIPGGEVPTAYKPYFDDPNELVDYCVNFRWQPPAIVRNSVSLTPINNPAVAAIHRTGTHLMTPETETTTHYFFCHTRHFELDDVLIDERTRMWQQSGLAQQDGPIIEAVQPAIGDVTDIDSLGPVLFSIDVAAVRVRRVLAKLVKEEAAAAVPLVQPGALGAPA